MTEDDMANFKIDLDKSAELSKNLFASIIETMRAELEQHNGFIQIKSFEMIAGAIMSSFAVSLRGLNESEEIVKDRLSHILDVALNGKYTKRNALQ